MRDQWLRVALIKGIARLQTPLVSDINVLGTAMITNHRRCRHVQHFSCRLFATTKSPLDHVFDDPYSNESPTTSSEVVPVRSASPTRRVRYSGKYPRDFNDKYKELSGDEATVQKVLMKGMTPAGRHVPILLNECLHHLGLDTTNTTSTTASTDRHTETTFYVDCTLGYGGHSSMVLRRLLEGRDKGDNRQHKMICFDRDPFEITKATERLHKIAGEHSDSTAQELDTMTAKPVFITTVNRNFCEVRSYIEAMSGGEGKVTALLADLGLSSMQVDDASRGFTYKREGPLDMRMSATAGNDTTTGVESAYDLLCRLSVKELTKMLRENSDEEHAEVIAQAILGKKQIPSTTMELAHIVRDAVRPLLSPTPKKKQQTGVEPPRRDSAMVKKQLDSTVARVMQAIRIQVNSEFEALEGLLDDLPHILAPGGRAVFLTFHSGEDRRVKKAFKTGFKDGVYTSWSRDVVRPTAEERRENPRSSCCKLRWVVRSDKSSAAAATADRK